VAPALRLAPRPGGRGSLEAVAAVVAAAVAVEPLANWTQPLSSWKVDGAGAAGTAAAVVVTPWLEATVEAHWLTSARHALSHRSSKKVAVAATQTLVMAARLLSKRARERAGAVAELAEAGLIMVRTSTSRSACSRNGSGRRRSSFHGTGRSLQSTPRRLLRWRRRPLWLLEQTQPSLLPSLLKRYLPLRA
jgi:hypothetical protein